MEPVPTQEIKNIKRAGTRVRRGSMDLGEGGNGMLDDGEERARRGEIEKPCADHSENTDERTPRRERKSRESKARRQPQHGNHHAMNSPHGKAVRGVRFPSKLELGAVEGKATPLQPRESHGVPRRGSREVGVSKRGVSKAECGGFQGVEAALEERRRHGAIRVTRTKPHRGVVSDADNDDDEEEKENMTKRPAPLGGQHGVKGVKGVMPSRVSNESGEGRVEGRRVEAPDEMGLKITPIDGKATVNHEVKMTSSSIKAIIPDVVRASYTVQRELGRGSFGVVYLAKHKPNNAKVLNDFGEYVSQIRAKEEMGYTLPSGEVEAEGEREVAVKLISPGSDEIREMALQEAKILSTASCKHVVRMESLICDPKSDKVCIVMEYCSGGKLDDYLLANGVVKTSDDVDIVRSLSLQMLTAVSYLHDELRIVHRDVKPDNVLVQHRPPDEKGKARSPLLKMCDFGLSSFFQSTRLMKLYCGTPSYTAPEIYAGGGYTRAVDCWALGVMIYYFFGLELPFKRVKKKDMKKNSGKDLRFMDECPVGARDLIMRLLCHEKLERCTAKEGLSHGWITGSAQVIVVPNVMEMLRVYTGPIESSHDGDGDGDGDFTPTGVGSPWRSTQDSLQS